MTQRWSVTLQDDATKEQWTVEVLATPPLAQANAEVSAIKAARAERGRDTVRCVFSRFVGES